MGEIGSGSGSSYSGAYDTNVSVEVNAPNPGKTKARKEVVEDLSSCIINIETTLGITPQGSKPTVVARLDQEHNADGSHKDSYIVTVSGQNQNITGRKVFASGISLGVDGLYGTATGYVNNAVSVSGEGTVRHPKNVRASGMWYSDPPGIKIKAGKTSGQSISNDVWTTITNWTLLQDDGNSGLFNTGNGIFTIPEIGYYFLHAQGAFSANATGIRGMRIWLDGYGPVVTFYIYNAGASYSTYAQVNTIKYLNPPSDTQVYVQVYQNSGIALNFANAGTTPENFFDLYRLSNRL